MFSMTEFTGAQFLVKGEDVDGTSGSIILDGTEYLYVKGQENVLAANEEFDAVVEDHFREITDAAEALKATLDEANSRDDGEFDLILETEVEGVEGRSAKRIRINTATIILRLVEAGETDRLRWVNDELLITAK